MAISEYVNKVLENNYLLSLVVAIICTIIFYLENRRSKHKYENVSYLKLCGIIAVAIISVLFVKNKKCLASGGSGTTGGSTGSGGAIDTSVKLEIGEPNF
jgi:hypothetical protein